MSTNNPHPSLQPRPNAPPSVDAPFPMPPPNLFSIPPEGIASTSTPSSPPPCAICTSPSKYTCPGCARSTCSALCSKTHKDKFGCTGERDPSKYVDLKSYGQGTWSDDFRYLEESRRRILGFAEGLPKDSLTSIPSAGPGAGVRGGPGGRGSGRGGRGGPGGGGGMGHLGTAERKTMGWKRQMSRRGVYVETMPEGMSRRKMNQSAWNPKNGTVHLTIHLSIPSDLLDPPLASSPLLVQHPRAIFSSSSTATPPATLTSLLPPSFPSSSLPSVVFLLPFHPSPSRRAPPVAGRSRPKLFFPPLDPSLPLDQILRGTSIIEFPVVQVMPKHTWIVLKAKGELGVVPLADVGPCVPPATVGPRSGKGRLVQEISKNGTAEGEANAKASIGGLADYASDEDCDEDEEVLEGGGEDEAMDEDPPHGDEGAEEEADVADILGAIEIPGGHEMMQRVSEALLADFGTLERDDEAEAERAGREMITEVETRR